MKLIDIHTHLDKLEEGVEQALALGEAAGVGGFITIGTDPEDLPVVLKLAETHYPKVLCTLGIHPHEAELYTPEVAQFIKTHAPQKEVAAVGEIGLDFFTCPCKTVALVRSSFLLGNRLGHGVGTPSIFPREGEGLLRF